MAGTSDSQNNRKEVDPSTENIFRITDELVRQVDKTKKMVIVMIVAIVVAVPVSWHVAPLLGTSDNFRIVGYFTIAIAAIFIAIGVRQWLQLSKWTKRYKTYKELQKKVDKELDF
jgi:high-affinity Fe2+/Pb2+ permease